MISAEIQRALLYQLMYYRAVVYYKARQLVCFKANMHLLQTLRRSLFSTYGNVAHLLGVEESIYAVWIDRATSAYLSVNKNFQDYPLPSAKASSGCSNVPSPLSHSVSLGISCSH